MSAVFDVGVAAKEATLFLRRREVFSLGARDYLWVIRGNEIERGEALSCGYRQFFMPVMNMKAWNLKLAVQGTANFDPRGCSELAWASTPISQLEGKMDVPPCPDCNDELITGELVIDEVRCCNCESIFSLQLYWS